MAEGAWLGLAWELGQAHRPVLPEGVSSLKPVNKVCYLLHVTAVREDALGCRWALYLRLLWLQNLPSCQARAGLPCSLKGQCLHESSNRTLLRLPKEWGSRPGSPPHPTPSPDGQGLEEGAWGPAGSRDLLLCPAVLKRSFVK